MGFLSSLFNVASSAADAVERKMERDSSSFSRGYDRGAQRASSMSDDELRSSLKSAKENGISGWNRAGEVRAMADEYKNRKK